MRLRPLENDDLSRIENLLQENPFKQDQIAFQQLDSAKLVSFHLKRLMERVDHPKTPIFMAESDIGIGLFGYRENEKHSDLFGKLVFTLDSVISYKLERTSVLKALESLQSMMFAQGADTIWGQCEEADTNLVQSFGRAGADYCGTSLRMSLWLQNFRFESSPGQVSIRPAVAGDSEELRAIALRSHRHSRFFRDPNLPEDKKKELFPDYLASSLGADRRPCLVAVDDNGRLKGFSLLLCPQGQEESLGRRIGIVDFIAVDPERQGGGVGGALLIESLRLLKEEGYELAELKTQLGNWGAIGFYNRWGFRAISAETHFSIGEKSA